MTDSISSIAPASDIQGMTTSQLYQRMEAEDVQNTDLSKEIDKTHAQVQRNLAQSTGDSSIASLAPQ